MNEINKIAVAVVYADPDRQVIRELHLAVNSTVKDAVAHADLNQEFPKVNFQAAPKGIFGQQVADDQVLQDGDRVEVYRPLALDPKEARRQRAGKSMQQTT